MPCLSYPKDKNRTEVGSIFQDGAVITMTGTGQGGGKRGASSVSTKTKQDYQKEIFLEIDAQEIRL